MCNIRPLLWHDAVFLLFAFFLFNNFDNWTYVREPHPLSEGKHRTFLCPIGQFCAINRNCNSQRSTHLVDREHSNHNTWLSYTPKSSSNMPEWAQKWTPVSPAPPPVLAIWGEQTAFMLAWSFHTTLSEYQALSEVVLNTYPIPSLFSSTLRGVVPTYLFQSTTNSPKSWVHVPQESFKPLSISLISWVPLSHLSHWVEPLKVSVISSSLLYLIVWFSGNKPIKLEGIR